MPKLAVSVPHTLTQQQATERLQERFNAIQEKFQEHVQDFQQQWEGNRLKFRFTTFGFAIQGSVASEPSEIQVHADLPLAALMFKGKIEQQIRDELGRALA